MNGGGVDGRERDLPGPAHSNSCIHLKAHWPSCMDRSGDNHNMIKGEYKKKSKNDRVSECKREKEREREKHREGGERRGWGEMEARETYQHTPIAVST